MAEASISVAHEQFCCPICLDLLKDPVTIPCGHSYCMNCITDCWNQDDEKEVYSCPQCRHTFTTKPALGKNTIVAEMVEKLKKTKLQTAVPAHCYTEAGDVACDACTGTKHKAVMSCLECLNSYCQNHLEQHENLFQGKRHNLMDATGRFQEMICRQHNKLLEVFCRTDQKCICMLCMMDDHKNHDTVPVAAERTPKQSHLEETQKKSQQRIQESEKKMEEVRRAVKSHKRSAQTAVEDSERIFTELMSSIERRRSEVTQLIRDQEKAAASRAEGLLERLEQEITDLRRRDTELEQLSHTHDQIQFLQSWQSFSKPSGFSVLPNITVSSLLSFDEVIKSVSQLKQQLEDFCTEHIDKISDRVTYIEIIPTNEPKTRMELLQYFHQLIVDPNTVNKHLRLSEGNRVITYTDTIQQYPDHPDRFNHWRQMLCRESVCGRCYWEIEWSGSDGVGISVSYKSISRKGDGYECVFGCNNQSWSLSCSPSRYSFGHNNKGTKLPEATSYSRIGVYVDHRAGILSFYNVSDTLTLIHRVHTTFTQSLYPAFGVGKRSSVKLYDVRI
ncbi:tripartite motif-containing protein 16-like protein [Xyrauchen texanus]|uniref:tripartite motif-containing protein 16-like protein n=1 Tax=Xyrauchen texanus TaxID=154827 RepID=UPI0022426592|nr:tripartite motif-containing protein 16-like protein [Xyrauchen texanus]